MKAFLLQKNLLKAPCFLSLLVCISLILLSSPVLANNGSMAYSFPVKNIRIDGDLSDWPSNAIKYEIERSQNRFSPKSKEDFHAFFITGYNVKDQSLYVGVEVTDESHIQHSNPELGHLNRDAHLLYLDAQHSLKGSGVAFYALSEDTLQLIKPELSWDPFIQQSNTSNIESVVKRKEGKTIYEWKIFLGDHLYPNRSIGLDHVIVDMDTETDNWKYSTIAWGSNGWKSSMQNNLGDVFLLEENATPGTLEGKVGWNTDTINALPWGLKVVCEENPALWTQVPLRGKSDYTTLLPPGNYHITSVLNAIYHNGTYLKTSSQGGVQATVLNGLSVQAPTFNLTIIPPPEFVQKKGLLHNFEAGDTAKVDQFFKQYMDYYEIPGVSLVLIENEEVVYHKTYGYKNLYTKDEVDTHTLFDAGSVTKPVFAFAVLRLAEKGIIDLDKPLYQYLPYEDIAHDSLYKLITARYVLSHQTGFPNWRSGKLEIMHRPGTKFGYSGEGFEYLKMVVEHLSGKDVEQVLMEEVLQPMGLEQTYFSKNEALLKALSFGHYEKAIQIHAPPEKPYMAYSMHTNALSFSHFLLNLMKETGLSAGMYQEMRRHQIDIPIDWPAKGPGWKQGYGLGFQLKHSPYGLVYGHGGKNGGFECNFEIYHELKSGYVYFTNSSSGNRIKNALRQLLITGTKN